MPTRFHSAYPGLGFAATHGSWAMEIPWHGRLYLGWRWVVNRARTLQLSSRNHPASLAEREIPTSVYLIGALTKMEFVEQERQ